MLCKHATGASQAPRAFRRFAPPSHRSRVYPRSATMFAGRASPTCVRRGSRNGHYGAAGAAKQTAGGAIAMTDIHFLDTRLGTGTPRQAAPRSGKCMVEFETP